MLISCRLVMAVLINHGVGCLFLGKGRIFLDQLAPLINKKITKTNRSEVEHMSPGFQKSFCDDVHNLSCGYINVTDGNMFYCLEKSQNDSEKDPLIIWLNGGPGVSSLLAMFYGVGYCLVDALGGLTANKNAWNTNSSVLFIDQPIGTGFSYGSTIITNSDEAAAALVGFLQKFFERFPAYRKVDLHAFGESYAGRYLPALSNKILEQNKNSRLETINLKSIGIGNGHFDYFIDSQYSWKMPCGDENSKSFFGERCNLLKSYSNLAKYNIEVCRNNTSENPEYCYSAATKLEQMMGIYEDAGISTYDKRRECRSLKYCYPQLIIIERFLNFKNTKRKLGVQKQYISSNDSITSDFIYSGTDTLDSSVEYMRISLEQGILVLIFSGDQDFICNWMANKAYSESINWKHQGEYINSKDHPWIYKRTGKAAGEVKLHRNLAFFRIYNSGHIVIR